MTITGLTLFLDVTLEHGNGLQGEKTYLSRYAAGEIIYDQKFSGAAAWSLSNANIIARDLRASRTVAS